MVVRAIEPLNSVAGAVDVVADADADDVVVVVAAVEEEGESLKVLAYRLVSLPLLAHQRKKGHPICLHPRALVVYLARDNAHGPGRLSEA